MFPIYKQPFKWPTLISVPKSLPLLVLGPPKNMFGSNELCSVHTEKTDQKWHGRFYISKWSNRRWEVDQYCSRVCERFQVPVSLRFRPRSNVRLNSFDRSVLRRTVQSPDRPRPPAWFGFISLKVAIFSHSYNLFHYYNLSKMLESFVTW